MERSRVSWGRLLGRAVSTVFRSSPFLAVANTVLLILQGILPVAALYLLKLTVDSLEGTIGGSEPVTFGHMALLVALMGAAALLTALARSLSGLAGDAQSRMVTDRMQDVLHERSVAVDLAYYEDSRFLDTLHRAQAEAPYRPTSIVNGLLRSVQDLVTLLAMAGLLLTFHWALSLVLVASSLPGVLVRMSYARRLWNWRRDSTETERASWYRHWLLTSADHAKELRLFGLGSFFRGQYRNLRETLRREMFGMARKRAAAEFAAQGSATLMVYGSFAYMAWRAWQGEITVGDLVMYFQAFQRGLSSLRGLLGSLAGLYEDSLFLSNLYEFLDLEPSVVSPPSPEPFPVPISRGISFSGVSFAYPGSDREVIRGLDLEVAAGETLALVGANGSGKTTLVKLLCRLYDPDDGRIEVDGIPLRDFSLPDLRSHVSVVFQDFARYQMTLAENIALGDIGAAGDSRRTREAAGLAGIEDLVSGLPAGFDTQLGRWFAGGVELSAGEWQKVAFARAMFRDAGIVILDEPTASLDAGSEREVFRRWRELAAPRTALLISHRFSSVKIADRIAVLDGGRIAECGTHAELMRIDGIYREMYSISAGAYG
jgi:ATP-binding cassette subfamily B protein